MSFTSSISQGSSSACQAGDITETRVTGRQKKGLRCLEDSGGLKHFGVSVMSKGILYLWVSVVVLGGSCAAVQEAHGMVRVLMPALVLANGWESVGHKGCGIFL